MVKVSNVLVHEEPQDVLCALVGVGRYLQHYLGVRKGGSNTQLVVYPLAEPHPTLAGWSDPRLPAPTLPVAGMWGAWGVWGGGGKDRRVDACAGIHCFGIVLF